MMFYKLYQNIHAVIRNNIGPLTFYLDLLINEIHFDD